MLEIWKYSLEITDSQTVLVPGNARFLSVIEQGDVPTLYALVDPSQKQVYMGVSIRGTGRPIDDNLLLNHRFLGTVITHGGRFVWHVFVEGSS